MVLLFKRRYNLRFLITCGLILLGVFFFTLLIQFSQIDTPSTERNIRNRLRNEALRQNSQQNPDTDRFKRIDSLKNRVANRFKFMNNYDNELDDKAIFYKTEFSKTMNSLQRLVHLDLKGSPPKLNYLKDLIPFFKKSGATGVLVEYEDFFPYKNDLESIKNQNHYTNTEIKQIFDILKENQLSIIPLIQTYGHLEFVLKLKEFSYLREAHQHFQVITPCNNDSYTKVLYKMIDQILEVHPEDLEYIHIGCDEVYHINVNPECKSLGLKTTQEFFI